MKIIENQSLWYEKSVKKRGWPNNKTTFVHNFLNTNMTGTVKFFNEAKGFGFITNDESGEDVFVHISALNGVTLREGAKVEYVEEDGKKGKQASNITVL